MMGELESNYEFDEHGRDDSWSHRHRNDPARAAVPETVIACLRATRRVRHNRELGLAAVSTLEREAAWNEENVTWKAAKDDIAVLLDAAAPPASGETGGTR